MSATSARADGIPAPGLRFATIACRECDLLQRERPLPPGAVARCVRCGAELYRDHPEAFERALGYNTGAMVLFVMANAFPLVGLKIKGDLVQTTLLGAVHSLWRQDMRLVAGVVLLTTFITPLVQMLALSYLLLPLSYLLLPLHFGRVPRHAAAVFRTMNRAGEWSMVEVFLLGVLVALVKLLHLASVVPGVALWSFGAMMLLHAAAWSAFDARALWARLERRR